MKVGEALVAKGLGALKGFVPFGNVICDVSADAIDRYRKANRAPRRRAGADDSDVVKGFLKEARKQAVKWNSLSPGRRRPESRI